MPDSQASTDSWSIGLVVLAAGAGTRMRSKLPKPLHALAGLPMIAHVLRAGAGARPESTTVVTSPAAPGIAEAISSQSNINVVTQESPKGTGDALLNALHAIDGCSHILVLFADHPLLTKETVTDLVDGARESGALVTILTCLLPDAKGYGRIERDQLDRPIRIVEQKDDLPEARTGETEINSGMMVLNAAWARRTLPSIQPSETTGECYLTDLVSAAVSEASENQSPWPVATVAAPIEVALGINDRIQLAEAESFLRDRIKRRHMLAGVTIREPHTVVIDDEVEIGQDTIILPNSMILGTSTIGADCVIGPGVVISNARIADRVTIRSSTITDSTIGEESDVGPYSHLRNGARIGPRVHIGNFGEIKNATIDENAKVGHFSYIGDAHVGTSTNVGAGTVTCNFDGVNKHHTEIGANVFVGSDSMLIAPITVGDGVVIGAGSVVTKDVPAGATVVGVPARQIKRSTSEADSASEDKGE
jgi:bifunctional UDP-N-acetylglucosamine pyrophosphorylase/glucosamine-1-phosphate N-acetyltransferase